jgi:hypothetical protein
MPENSTPFDDVSNTSDTHYGETTSVGSTHSAWAGTDATKPASPSQFGKKSSLLIAVTALLLVAIVVASTWLAIYASFHTVPLATPTSTAPTEQVSLYPTYMPGHGTLVFSDPLNGVRTQFWKPTTGCSYTQNHYQITVVDQTQPVHVCLGPTLRNFAFEVQMTIAKGDCGGLVFRGDLKNNVFYNYMVCQLGVYSLTKYVGNNPGVSLIKITSSPAINGNVNQSNTLGIYANGDNIIVYANGKQLGSVHDNTSAMGQLGLDAVALSNGSTQVLYSYATAWSLQ